MSRRYILIAVALAYLAGAVSYREYHWYREPHGPLSKILHIGVLVPNLDQAIAKWQAMGFHDIRRMPDSSIDAEYRGAALDTQLHKAFVVDSIPQIELMEPEQGKPNPWANELQEKGEVLHHIAYQVADETEELNKFEKLGMQDIAGTKSNIQPGQLVWHYLKQPDSSLIIEFISTAPNK